MFGFCFDISAVVLQCVPSSFSCWIINQRRNV